jgi:hypothetical protein
MSTPEDLARTIVVVPLHCRRCGYNLYRLRADGHCPECGTEIWQTILHTVDPAASRLPRLHNPAAVGQGLLWVQGALVVLTMLLGLRPLAEWIDRLDQSGLRDLTSSLPSWLGFLELPVILAGLWGVWRMLPADAKDPESKPVKRHLLLMAAGFLVGGVGLVALAVIEGRYGRGAGRDLARLAVTVPAIVGLLGLGGVLRIIGLRSRLYRTARSGRQGLLAMVAAMGGVAFGVALRVAGWLLADEGQVFDLAGRAVEMRRALLTAGSLVAVISILMLVIGLIYLTANIWWVSRSLRRPPPALGELLGN